MTTSLAAALPTVDTWTMTGRNSPATRMADAPSSVRHALASPGVRWAALDSALTCPQHLLPRPPLSGSAARRIDTFGQFRVTPAGSGNFRVHDNFDQGLLPVPGQPTGAGASDITVASLAHARTAIAYAKLAATLLATAQAVLDGRGPQMPMLPVVDTHYHSFDVTIGYVQQIPGPTAGWYALGTSRKLIAGPGDSFRHDTLDAAAATVIEASRAAHDTDPADCKVDPLALAEDVAAATENHRVASRANGNDEYQVTIGAETVGYVYKRLLPGTVCSFEWLARPVGGEELSWQYDTRAEAARELAREQRGARCYQLAALAGTLGDDARVAMAYRNTIYQQVSLGARVEQVAEDRWITPGGTHITYVDPGEYRLGGEADLGAEFGVSLRHAVELAEAAELAEADAFGATADQQEAEQAAAEGAAPLGDQMATDRAATVADIMAIVTDQPPAAPANRVELTTDDVPRSGELCAFMRTRLADLLPAEALAAEWVFFGYDGPRWDFDTRWGIQTADGTDIVSSPWPVSTILDRMGDITFDPTGPDGPLEAWLPGDPPEKANAKLAQALRCYRLNAVPKDGSSTHLLGTCRDTDGTVLNVRFRHWPGHPGVEGASDDEAEGTLTNERGEVAMRWSFHAESKSATRAALSDLIDALTLLRDAGTQVGP